MGKNTAGAQGTQERGLSPLCLLRSLFFLFFSQPYSLSSRTGGSGR